VVSVVLLDDNGFKKLYELADGSILLISKEGLFSPLNTDNKPRTLAEAQTVAWKPYEWSLKSPLQ
jgi:hypothetical protein